MEVASGASIHLTGPNFGPIYQYGRLCDNYVYNPRVRSRKKECSATGDSPAGRSQSQPAQPDSRAPTKHRKTHPARWI